MEHDDAATLPPPRIPGLAPLRLLGVGGRSAVWLVQCTAAAARTITWVGDGPPQKLALKLPLSRARSAPSLRSAQQELEAMLPLVHDHLVRPWGVLSTSQGSTGILLQPYTAGSLGQLLHSAGPLSSNELVTALTPVAQALEHLHTQGAAHGDVSAANILLTPEGEPALGDLGDSAVLGTGARGGTPEQDVMALAGVAWEALTGSQPPATALRAPLQSLLPGVPTELAELLESALGSVPGELPLAGEFAAELYACAEPEPLSLLPTIDDHAVMEMPTIMPGAGPAHTSKLPFSKRLFRVWRKRPASAPSTIR
ncbi:protein kinase domain-containing protein [Nesterenkonia ebinurensis]|uniref:protein kinase domain-containing protein n=1 Tax=Nesterenkonia ebinurensis TaxID=2608252 RepID=UPI00168BC606|nr:protein kinase [Nesterenkonia ebinurensis]